MLLIKIRQAIPIRIQYLNIILSNQRILQFYSERVLRMQKEVFYQFPKIPYTKEGFTVSFDLKNFDPMEVASFYHTFGFVVFDDVVNEEEAERTIDQLWSNLQDKCGKEHNRHDPSTWKFEVFRGKYGFVNGQPLRSRQICLNRSNPNTYKAFKSLYQLSSGYQLNQPLIAQFDRGSAMRPGKINHNWLTLPIYHFDINPWWWTGVVPCPHKNWKKIDYSPQKFIKALSQGCFTPFSGYTKLAGVLALSDTNELSGGFECVPGFQNIIKYWCETTPYNTQIQNQEGGILLNNFQRIFQKKRSLLVFSRELPHNIYPNLSQNFRFAQYVRFSPQSTLQLTPLQKQKRKVCVRQFLPKDLPVEDPISKEIYMMD